LVTSHEHKLLTLSAPQSYPLLSVKSKVTEAANNKERLDERHNNVCVVPYLDLFFHFFFQVISYSVL